MSVSEFAPHPTQRWTISINAALVYFSTKRLIQSAITDSVIQHNKEHPDKPIMQLAVRPALLSDNDLDDLDE